MVSGSAGYVLPRLDNRVFLDLKPGQYFGHSELSMDRDFINVKKIKRPSGYKNLIRQFTVQSFDNCELLLVETVDLLKMKSEFPICFSQLVENAKSSLKKELMLKLEVVRIS